MLMNSVTLLSQSVRSGSEGVVGDGGGVGEGIEGASVGKAVGGDVEEGVVEAEG